MMDKFKKGDVVETTYPEDSMAYALLQKMQNGYEVTGFDDRGGAIATLVYPEARVRSLGTSAKKCYLGKDPSKYKLISRKSKKDQKIAELEKQVAEASEEAAKLNKSAAGAMAEKNLLEGQIEVDKWARTEAMLDAGYVSIDALRSIAIRGGLSRRYNGPGTHEEADIVLMRHGKESGKFYDRFLNELYK